MRISGHFSMSCCAKSAKTAKRRFQGHAKSAKSAKPCFQWHPTYAKSAENARRRFQGHYAKSAESAKQRFKRSRKVKSAKWHSRTPQAKTKLLWSISNAYLEIKS